MPIETPTMARSMPRSRARSARSTSSLERYGSASDNAVPSNDSATTAPSRRQYGAMYASVRRMSRSTTGTGLSGAAGSGGWCARNQNHTCHVGAEVDGAYEAEVGHIVEVDRRARGVD